MKLKVKDLNISTGKILVAILNEKDAKKIDVHSGDRLLVKHGKKEATCILDISSGKKSVPEGRIGLMEEVLTLLHLHQGEAVDVLLTGKPESVKHIRDKLLGRHLSYQELYHIMDDFTHDRLTDIEKTYFVAATFTRGLSTEEIVDLTRAMVETGKKIKFPGITLDKHSIGGLPGNRTTMIIVPILAAAGFTVAKTSSRAITSAAGTADTMECLAKVELTEKEIKDVVRKTGACMVHGGAIQLAPSDDKIIEVEHPLSIDPEGQLLASVMAKKYSVSSQYVLIDIPLGKTSKVHTREKAKHLQHMFELIGRKLEMQIKVIITDGSQPIGRGVGPLFEAQDVLAVLRNDPDAPQDLKKKSLMMAGLLLDMASKDKNYQNEKKMNGIKVAQEILESGKAWKKMHQIIHSQGAVKRPKIGQYRYEVHCDCLGRVKEIDNEIIAKVARIAGAPEDKGAGIFIVKKVHDEVKRNDLLYSIYAESKVKLELAKEMVTKDHGYVVR